MHDPYETTPSNRQNKSDTGGKGSSSYLLTPNPQRRDDDLTEPLLP